MLPPFLIAIPILIVFVEFLCRLISFLSENVVHEVRQDQKEEDEFFFLTGQP